MEQSLEVLDCLILAGQTHEALMMQDPGTGQNSYSVFCTESRIPLVSFHRANPHESISVFGNFKGMVLGPIAGSTTRSLPVPSRPIRTVASHHHHQRMPLLALSRPSLRYSENSSPPGLGPLGAAWSSRSRLMDQKPRLSRKEHGVGWLGGHL